MKFNNIILLCVSLMWMGCAKTTYIEYKEIKPQENKQETLSLHVNTSGIVKGYVQSLYLEGTSNLWVYEVKGTDITNDKVPFIKFYSNKKIAKVHDMIYAVVQDEKLVEYFLLNSSKVIKKGKKKEEVVQEELHKRTKKRKTPWIDVPKSESIHFD